MLVISLLFGVHFAGDYGVLFGIVGAIFVMFLIGMGLVSLGIAFASKIQNMKGFPVMMNFLVMPMFFLSGAMYPINSLPD